MWAHFRFYVAGLLMCIGCLLPAAMFKLPEDAIGGIGALVVFFAGGGLLYMLWNLYWNNENGEWKDHHETLIKVLSLVFAILGLGLQILCKVLYNGSDFVIFDILNYKGSDPLPIFVRALTVIISGLAAYPIFGTFTGEIDMSVHRYIRTTYNSRGDVIGQKEVSHREDLSVVSYFFMTVLMGILGIMLSSLSTIVFVVVLNIVNLIRNAKANRTVLILGIIASVVFLFVRLYFVYNSASEDMVNIELALNLMPTIFLLLIYFYYLLYTHFEAFSTVMLVIIFSFVLFFIAYIASFGISFVLMELFKILPF